MQTAERPRVFERMTTLADGLRSRILLVLEGRELTVTELCAVLRLPQSTVSRHLKILSDAGWITMRPEGTSRLYRHAVDALDAPAAELWALARTEIEGGAAALEDALRLEGVLGRRRHRSRQFFADGAERWEALRDELFGDRFYLFGLLGLLDREMTLADLGCGTGTVSEAVAPMIRRVIAVDESAAMLAVARRRLGGFGNVELREGELERLPIADGSVDAATMILVLPHIAEPPRVLAEAARILRTGGRLVVVDLLTHDRHEFQQEMGHVWLGFGTEQIERFLREAGLRDPRVTVLPLDPSAKGPALFAATARSGERVPEPKR